jgi:hypothetical protein
MQDISGACLDTPQAGAAAAAAEVAMSEVLPHSLEEDGSRSPAAAGASAADSHSSAELLLCSGSDSQETSLLPRPQPSQLATATGPEVGEVDSLAAAAELPRNSCAASASVECMHHEAVSLGAQLYPSRSQAGDAAAAPAAAPEADDTQQGGPYLQQQPDSSSAEAEQHAEQSGSAVLPDVVDIACHLGNESGASSLGSFSSLQAPLPCAAAVGSSSETQGSPGLSASLAPAAPVTSPATPAAPAGSSTGVQSPLAKVEVPATTTASAGTQAAAGPALAHSSTPPAGLRSHIAQWCTMMQEMTALVAAQRAAPAAAVAAASRGAAATANGGTGTASGQAAAQLQQAPSHNVLGSSGASAAAVQGPTGGQTRNNPSSHWLQLYVCLGDVWGRCCR